MKSFNERFFLYIHWGGHFHTKFIRIVDFVKEATKVWIEKFMKNEKRNLLKVRQKYIPWQPKKFLLICNFKPSYWAKKQQRYSEGFWKLPPKQDYVITPIMALQIFENELGVLKSLSNVSYFTFTYLVDRNIIGELSRACRLFIKISIRVKVAGNPGRNNLLTKTKRKVRCSPHHFVL